MPESKRRGSSCLNAYKRGLVAWILTAAICLLISSCLVAKGIISYKGIGYLSSGISFLAALFAGNQIGKGECRSLLNCITGAVCLVIILLTLGSIISRGSLSPSGILSAATFTITGFLTGSLLPIAGGNKKRKSAINVRTKKR